MNRTLAVAAALAFASAGAWADSASLQILDFTVAVHATDASLQPQPSVVFSGGNSADTEITSTPPASNPFGPPGYTIMSEGVVTSPSAFGEVLSLTDLVGLGTSAASAYFAGMGDVGASSGEVSSEDDTGAFPNFGSLTLGGDSFTLSARSQLVITADLLFDASGETASASLGFAGQPSWADATAQGSFERIVSLAFTNDTGQPLDGRFSAAFRASSVPEPSTAALLAVALIAFGSVARSRRV